MGHPALPHLLQGLHGRGDAVFGPDVSTEPAGGDRHLRVVECLSDRGGQGFRRQLPLMDRRGCDAELLHPPAAEELVTDEWADHLRPARSDRGGGGPRAAVVHDDRATWEHGLVWHLPGDEHVALDRRLL
jgi:hypothetical protein